MRVGLDIDNVIADLDKTYLKEFLLEDKNKRNTGIIDENAKHIIHGMFDWSKDEVKEFVSNNMDRMGKSFDVIQDAKCYIDKLKRDGHEIYLVTYRKNEYWKEPEKITKEWLKEYDIYYDELIFTKGKDKSIECIENKIDIMFDDVIDNCISIIKVGIPCYLVATKYNLKYNKKLKIVNNWKEIYEAVCIKNQKIKVILDTDMYNECDDQFALAYLLQSQDKFDIQAITVAPYQHKNDLTIEEGIDKSYNEICKICDWLNYDQTNKIFKGVTNYLRDGVIENEAVTRIVEIALSNDKTYILAIGAITNIAMAILKEPQILKKIEIVWLGGHNLLSTDNLEFNFRQDVEAVKTVFDSKVKLTIIPCKGVASNLMTSIYELKYHLKGKSELCDYLCVKFNNDGRHGIKERRIVWDISVIAYLINDQWFELKEINCPIINEDTSYEINTNKHKITMVNYVDANHVYNDLFKKLV